MNKRQAKKIVFGRTSSCSYSRGQFKQAVRVIKRCGIERCGGVVFVQVEDVTVYRRRPSRKTLLSGGASWTKA